MAGKLTELRNGRIYDPANGVDGEIRTLYLGPDGIVAAPTDPGEVAQSYDLAGCAVMAGGIDIHTHIGGGKVNLARMLLPEDHRRGRDPLPRPVNPLEFDSCGTCAPGTLSTGYRYVEMGYTEIGRAHV